MRRGKEATGGPGEAVATPAAEGLACIRLQSAPLSPRHRALLFLAAGGSAVRAVALAQGQEARRVVGDDVAAWLSRVDDAAAERELEAARERGLTVMVRTDPDLPAGLGELPDPPLALWVRGRLPPEPVVGVAIVGARKATAYGLHVARDLGRGLAEAGALVVSGGARGVDGAAHAGALEAGAPTLAVLGCGLDVIYPREHRRLFDSVAEAGALVSEHPLGTPPRALHFPARNRLLAAWSRAVVVVEARARSGSLITARLALEGGREVLAVPGPVTSPASEGPNELLVRGARPARGPADVLEELGADARGVLAASPWRRVEAQPTPPAAAEVEGSDALLSALVPGEELLLDDLAARLSAEPGDLLARVALLELRGLLVRGPGGRLARA